MKLGANLLTAALIAGWFALLITLPWVAIGLAVVVAAGYAIQEVMEDRRGD